MIFLTGDTHGNIDLQKLINFANQRPDLTKDDYLIICGDWGVLWDNESSTWEKDLLRQYDAFPWTTLFIDGNHENFQRLNALPVEEWHGGKIHRVTDSVLHLMRGQVFTFAGREFFVFGGAESPDKVNRTPYKSWWPEEEPSPREEMEAVRNLDQHGWKVDTVITHTLPGKYINQVFRRSGFSVQDEAARFLDQVEAELTYERWYCGHLHVDREVTEKITVLYNKILQI